MKFRMSWFIDAFLGSGVPIGGDPVTSFWNESLLGLRTATVVNNCRPLVRDVVKVRFLAINYGERRLEVAFPVPDGRERDRGHAGDNLTMLLPGESLEYSVFRMWDVPGEHQLTLAYEARSTGLPFARLTCPKVAIHVRPPEVVKLLPWVLSARAVHPTGQHNAQ
jgi:hypothetical protein